MNAPQIKHFGFVVKKAEMPYEAFAAHWLNTHAPLVHQMPGLLRYVANLVDRQRFPDFGYDGFSELWFESEVTRDASFASAQARLVVADLPNFVERRDAVVAQEFRLLWT